MANVNGFVQVGKTLDYFNSSNAAIGYLDIVVGTDRIFIAAESIAVNELGSVSTEGVFEFDTTTNEVFTIGQKLFYDVSEGLITSTPTGNIYVGYSTEIKATATATANVKLIDGTNNAGGDTNVIEIVELNGTPLTVTDKTVDVVALTTKAANQAIYAGSDHTALATAFNDLLLKLKTAGIMTADS